MNKGCVKKYVVLVKNDYGKSHGSVFNQIKKPTEKNGKVGNKSKERLMCQTHINAKASLKKTMNMTKNGKGIFKNSWLSKFPWLSYEETWENKMLL